MEGNTSTAKLKEDKTMRENYYLNTTPVSGVVYTEYEESSVNSFKIGVSLILGGTTFTLFCGLFGWIAGLF